MCDLHDHQDPPQAAQLRQQRTDFMTADPVDGLQALPSLAGHSTDERRALLAGVRSGEITELLVDIVAFRAIYPNANFLRFREEDTQNLANTFANQPFLRNHDTQDIGSRDGTIVASRMNGVDMFQTVRITTQRGMEDYLQGRIDRFSIGWYYDTVKCSICNQEWFDCAHWPGRRYEVEDGDGKQLCELIFINPTGKETSAVNVPAVRGTRVLWDANEPAIMLSEGISQLCQAKEEYQHKLQQTTLAAPPPPSPDADPAPQTATVLSSVEAVQEATTMDPEIVETQTTEAPATPVAVSNAAAVIATQANNLSGMLTYEQQPSITIVPAHQAPFVPSHPVSSNTIAPILQAIQAAQQPPQASPAAPTGPTPEYTAWLTQMKDATINQMLFVSGLSAAAQKAVRVALGDNIANVEPQRVQALIDAQRDVEAKAIDRNVVTGINPTYNGVTGVLDSLDKYKLAFGAMLDGKRPDKGVKPLTGIREAYIQLSGDYEMTGRYYGDRIFLSNVNTSTMADLMAEFLNMRIIRSFQSYNQFWRPFCQVENFTSLHDPHWLILGGIGELSDVAEGATYTERGWAVETETTPWMKKGNWLGLTLEAIDKDQTGYLQQAPRALAQAAYLSLGKTFTRIFTNVNGAGYGPTMRDVKPLFHADHNNLGVSPLDGTAWDATRIAMARHTEDGSGEVLGGLTVPRYIMVPRHLENKALTIFATEGLLNSSLNDINPLAVDGSDSDSRRQAARRMIIVNDFLALANHWYALADPAQYPLLGLGFRFGEAPEIYSVADERSGLMFSNDVLPVKIRFFFSMGPMDYRGFFKHAAP